MAIVVSDRQRIHYEFEGERGAFVILHHGLFGAMQDWHDAGYVDDLVRDFRLILMDARGHGRSERSDDPADYTLTGMANDVVAVLDELDIRNAHFIGYSLGALVGFELLRRHPERVRLVMLGGEAPMVTEDGRHTWAALAEAVRGESLGRVVQDERAAERLVGDAPVQDETDRDAALALLDAMAGWEVPDTEQVQVRSPITVYCGGDDPALARAHDGARLVQRARFIPFGGYTHRRLFHERQALLEAILRFIRISRRAGEGTAPAERRGPRQRRRGGPPPAPEAAESAVEGGAAAETPAERPDETPDESPAAPDGATGADEESAAQPAGAPDTPPPATSDGAEPEPQAGPAPAPPTGTPIEAPEAAAGGESAPAEAPPSEDAEQRHGQRRGRRRSGRDRRRGRGRRGKRGQAPGDSGPTEPGKGGAGPTEA